MARSVFCGITLVAHRLRRRRITVRSPAKSVTQMIRCAIWTPAISTAPNVIDPHRKHKNVQNTRTLCTFYGARFVKFGGFGGKIPTRYCTNTDAMQKAVFLFNQWVRRDSRARPSGPG